MSYIGRGTDKISNIEKLDTITFDGSSSYTLQKNSVNFTPNSANSLQVSIDGVVQAGNFTVSGSTIDFGVAIPSTSTCDFIFHYGTGLVTTVADGAITTAKLGDASVTSAKLDSGISLGISEADEWRITTDYSKTGGGTADITANWERNDNAIFSKIGTGMTESSGIFSFPSTGIYMITGQTIMTSNGGSRLYMGIIVKGTADNSSYSEIIGGYQSVGTSGYYASVSCTGIFDVTNITTHKVKMSVSVESSVIFQGNTNVTKTGLTFIRLGDT